MLQMSHIILLLCMTLVNQQKGMTRAGTSAVFMFVSPQHFGVMLTLMVNNDTAQLFLRSAAKYAENTDM